MNLSDDKKINKTRFKLDLCIIHDIYLFNIVDLYNRFNIPLAFSNESQYRFIIISLGILLLNEVLYSLQKLVWTKSKAC